MFFEHSIQKSLDLLRFFFFFAVFLDSLSYLFLFSPFCLSLVIYTFLAARKSAVTRERICETVGTIIILAVVYFEVVGSFFLHFLFFSFPFFLSGRWTGKAEGDCVCKACRRTAKICKKDDETCTREEESLLFVAEIEKRCTAPFFFLVRFCFFFLALPSESKCK